MGKMRQKKINFIKYVLIVVVNRLVSPLKVLNQLTLLKEMFKSIESLFNLIFFFYFEAHIETLFIYIH